MPRFWPLLLVVLIACGDNTKGPVDAGPDMPDGMEEEVCENLAPLPAGTCEVTAGDGRKLLKGNVLTPGKVLRGGQVAVDTTGQITCVGCDCAQGGETVVTCPDGAISPGLINTHDHITFTHNDPYTDTGVRYEHRHQWRRGQDGKPRITSSGGASSDQILWGELRFLMGGATSIVGSGGRAGLLRNLDSTQQEGLGQGVVNFDTFPLDDSGGARRTGNCDYGGEPTTAAQIANVDAYEPHTSEGIDDTARNEFLCQSSESYDTTTPGISHNLVISKTAMIHAIGLTAADYAAMAGAGTALIWSPRSNITLYGDTARVTTAARLGVEIALGTDWMPTGSMNLLRELRCAAALNETYYDSYFTDEQLWMMVTANAASVTATDDAIGVLAPGRVADITIFTGHGKTYRAVIDAEPQDVALVMRGGKVLYGDDAAVAALAQSCDAVDVCGTGKRVCLSDEVGKTYAQLQTGAGANIYPAFACGEPTNEPSCTPTRPTYSGAITPDDSDGDGIVNTGDKCPTVFDPVRPLDTTGQPDTDGDGDGDACDVCPFDADSTTCSVADPNDRDADGVVNTSDNCPDNANTDQADGDSDGKGDVCDACPNDANPGAAGCPKTIYEIKNGSVPLGTQVVVNNALVTGRGSNGFFVQVKETDSIYTGPDHSGMFVFTGSGAATLANATVGARVQIAGRVANFQGQIELDSVSAVTVQAPGPEAPPMPVTATYAEVKTGGTRALTLESVIVRLGPAAVTATDAMFGEYTLSDGTDMLIVDDFLFAPDPAPQNGDTFTQVTGILALRQMQSKLEPRDAGDLVAGAPGLASFGPALSYARVGTTTNAPTFPEPLTVRLTAAPAADTMVVIMSSSTDLVVANVTIPAGQTSAVVPVTAVAQNMEVTLTATLGVQMRQASVRVLGADEVPQTVTLSPMSIGVAQDASVQLTATLDVPAPAGGSTVTLAVDPANAGTLPASVMIAEGQTSATFTYTHMLATGTATITATFGADTSEATVTTFTGLDHLVISQIYGGGGNSGAPLSHDYIEVFNPTSAAISLAGLSVQYASHSGTTWQVTALPNVMLQPGQYFLIQEGSSNTSVGAALPTPDATGGINMGASQGKVALVASTTALSGACPTVDVVDLVGYDDGTPSTTCFEGAPATGGTNTTSLLRAMGGCTDTEQNDADFTAGTPTPRNTSTAAATCM